MIPEKRKKFNDSFSTDKYQAVLKDLRTSFGVDGGFRVAETPVFMPRYLKNRLIEASSEIMHSVMSPEYLDQSLQAIPKEWNTPGKSDHPEFVVADFAITLDENGLLKPMLIEVQGFPSVYFFQIMLDVAIRNNFEIEAGLNPYFTDLNADSFKALLKRVIIHNHPVEEVILLELEPEKQTTYIDFIGAEKMLGIKSVCVSEIIKEGRTLFYHLNGKKQRISRIFNRVIADDWANRTDLKASFAFTDDLDVSWAGHPNWFFRLSKFSMPFIHSSYVPETRILSQVSEIPKDLENYVLKPLFSFSGSGVIFNVTTDDILAVQNPDEFILQKKVVYYPGILSPDEPVKCEIRVMLVWPEGDPKPSFTTNLTRLSKGDLIGVKFNKNKDWVGGSLTYFED